MTFKKHDVKKTTAGLEPTTFGSEDQRATIAPRSQPSRLLWVWQLMYHVSVRSGVWTRDLLHPKQESYL